MVNDKALEAAALAIMFEDTGTAPEHIGFQFTWDEKSEFYLAAARAAISAYLTAAKEGEEPGWHGATSTTIAQLRAHIESLQETVSAMKDARDDEFICGWAKAGEKAVEYLSNCFDDEKENATSREAIRLLDEYFSRDKEETAPPASKGGEE